MADSAAATSERVSVVRGCPAGPSVVERRSVACPGSTEPASALRTLRSVAVPGAVLSLLEKNRDGLTLRPGLQGDYAEALRLLTERDSIGRLGVRNRAFDVAEWLAMLDQAG